MTDADTPPAKSLAERVAHLEQSRANTHVSAVFARFYAPFAVAAPAMSFLPPFEDVTSGPIRWTYGTLWEMAARGGPAPIAVLVLLALVALLVVATIQANRSQGLPVAIATCAGLLALMLVLRPGTGDPTPPLTDAGVAEIVVLACCMVVAIVHAFQGRRRKSSV